MAEELLINVNPYETRVALVSHGLLQEIHVARSQGYSVTGNLYLGKVERIVPGMQAAFVNVGLARPGFLHARDIDSPRIFQADGEVAIQKTDIRDLIHEGQEILVQVEKDPISSKGARLSTQIALASKYMVLMPLEKHIGISQRIDEEQERDRLRQLLDQVRIEAGEACRELGIIARTASEGVSVERLQADFNLLERVWEKVSLRSKKVSAPAVVFEELPLHSRMVRELVGNETETVFVDDEQTYGQIRGYVDEFIPGFAERLHFYDGKRPLFERHGVEDETKRALNSKVELKSGGSLVIEQTEAMISIDVNTGGFLGGHSLEETVFRANLEAASAIPRQLRLRNLGGIVVIDFIDMEEEDHQRQVLRALEKASELDPARTRIEGFSSLGLVQMSRKRTRESLVQMMCQPCDHCEGAGFVKSAESTCVEVLRALSQDHKVQCRGKLVEGEYLIRATEAVVDRLLDEDAGHLTELSQSMQQEIRIQVEPSYFQGQFDIVLVQNVSR
ncbi:MAG: ribonuclease G [Candidatus Azotimanducaceae bacterium]|jgi:ribonuclease G